MSQILSVVLLYAVFCALFYIRKDTWQKPNIIYIILPCVIGISLRLVLAAIEPGYATDMQCWRSWASRVASVLPPQFYSDTYFCDYPPGYLWILWPLGWLSDAPMPLQTILFKLPAIVTDMICGLIIYNVARRRQLPPRTASFFLFLYVINPAIFVNSAVWGQVDSLFTLFLLLSCLNLAEEKYPKSAIWLAIAIAFKPQALLVTPIYALVAISKCKEPGFMRLLLKTIGAGLLTFLIIVFPFTIGKEPLFICKLYFGTLSSYPYASLNAFNLFTLLGANGVSQNAQFAGLSYGTWGTIGMVLSILVSLYLFRKGNDKSRFFYTAALLLCGVFTFGAKMHERYLFPALILFFAAYLYRRDKRILLLSFVFSALHFINVAYLYELSLTGTYYATAPDAVASIISFLTVLCTLCAFGLGFSLYAKLPSLKPLSGKFEKRITKRDILYISIVTLLYSALAFYNLGNTSAPSTHGAKDNFADLGQIQYVDTMSVYQGIGEADIHVELSQDNVNWFALAPFEGASCFKWTNYPIGKNARFIRVQFSKETDSVYEVAFWDKNCNLLPVQSESALFDEQSLAEYENTYQNSTYFDEIYHARTAYEHIEYIPHYETTHPPLGKLLIGVGIRLFGMNPFGWRFMGTLFGVLLLPLMYIFAKRIFRHTFFATAAMLFFAFDFMHFSQTRIATIDSYGVFFILLSYYFMYLFYSEATSLPTRRVHLYLALSGAAFGLAIASKWIGFYAGVGLCILFFTALFRRVRKKNIKELAICGFCILYFLLIPFIIYYISYIPIHIADGAESYWNNFWNYQTHMFSYHSELTERHPYESAWYTWPFMIRPIWYYGNKSLLESGLVSSIVGMGNPLLWWAGLISILYCLFYRIKRKRATFIVIGYLSQFVPWIFISRACFIYHYFASVPFLILALVYALKCLCLYHKSGKYITLYLLIFCGILFFAFYPVLSGMPCPRSYMLSALTWFASWTLGY